MCVRYVFAYFLAMFCVQNMAALEETRNISEILELKRLYLNQQALIETLKQEIEDQDKHLIDANSKLTNHQQRLQQIVDTNALQTKQLKEMEYVMGEYGHVSKTSMNKRQTEFNRRLTLRQSEDMPAFYASLSASLSHLGDHQTIIFDNVHTNILHGYDNATGIFTVPSHGVYVFSWTTTSKAGTKMASELVVKGARRGTTLSDSSNLQDDSSASNTVVIEVRAGETVWVRTGTSTSHTGDVLGGDFSTFSGWKLF